MSRQPLFAPKGHSRSAQGIALGMKATGEPTRPERAQPLLRKLLCPFRAKKTRIDPGTQGDALGWSVWPLRSAGSKCSAVWPVNRVVILGLVLAASTVALADDPIHPPVRFQRKERTQPEMVPEKLPVPPKEVPTPEGTPLQQSIEETLARLTGNLEKTDERLRQQDVGEETRQAQAEVVRGLDDLIEHLRQQQQQQQPQQSSASSRSAKNQPQASKAQTTQSSAGQKPQPGQQPGEQQANTGQGGGRSLEERRELADLYRDVWGHLPETVRQQMDAYARERFMPKYSELLKQYYSTLAEKGRRTGDD